MQVILTFTLAYFCLEAFLNSSTNEHNLSKRIFNKVDKAIAPNSTFSCAPTHPNYTKNRALPELNISKKTVIPLPND